MTTTNIQTLATEARSFMVSKTRDDGSKFWSRSDDAPEWVRELCFAAHDAGDMLPDDHRYEFIVEALDALSDTEDADDVNLEADIYTHNLTTWLASRADRSGYCDSAMEEFGITEYKSLVEHLQIGQAYEKAEVLGSVRSSLETRAEETSEETEDSDDEETDEGTVEEGDITTSDGTTFYQDGKLYLRASDPDSASRELRAKMDADQFWPNVWMISDHGNVIRFGLDD
jgi:hypothetical protein